MAITTRDLPTSIRRIHTAGMYCMCASMAERRRRRRSSGQPEQQSFCHLASAEQLRYALSLAHVHSVLASTKRCRLLQGHIARLELELDVKVGLRCSVHPARYGTRV